MDSLEELKRKIINLKDDFEKDLNPEKDKSVVEKNPQVLLEWESPLRPYRKFSFVVVRFFLAIALLITIILIFFNAYTLIIPIWTTLFLFFVLTITPPPRVKNKITVFGVEVAGVISRWEILDYFYIDKKFGTDVLYIVGIPPFNFIVSMVLPNEEIKKKAIEHLSQFIFYKEKKEKKLVDKLISLFSNLLPEEKFKSKTATSS